MAIKTTHQASSLIASEARKIIDFQKGFGNNARLSCIQCHAVFPTDKPLYKCTHDGDLLEVLYDFPKTVNAKEMKDLWLLRRLSNRPVDASGVWRFRDLFPFVEREQDIVTLGEGNTRLLEAPHAAEYTGLKRLMIKHQGDNPTGSFKDPGMTAAITQAKILGMQAVVCASTGNTSASMAAYARKAGMLPIVMIPEGQIAYGKLSQSLDYGALTIQIKGDFDKAMSMVMQVAPKLGVYVVNSINAFRIEGQKSIVMELFEQLDWQVPDRIVVPGGNLGHASAIAKGLRELKAFGMIKKIPRLTVVQAKGASPLYRTVTSNNPNQLTAVHAKTLASAIKIGNPVSWKKALAGVTETDGWVTAVTEQQIADAKAVIGREGIGAEPASAVTIAGLKQLVAKGTDQPFDADEFVVAILTGHVLKDPDYTVFYHRNELYEEFETNIKLTAKGKKLRSKFGNAPVISEATEEALAQVITKGLKTEK